jgi:hypothetical protein
VLATLRALLEAGERSGVFRRGVDPVDLHWMISSLCFYRVSNRHTWKVNFGVDLADPKHTATQRRMAVEAILRFLAPDPPPRQDKDTHADIATIGVRPPTRAGRGRASTSGSRRFAKA